MESIITVTRMNTRARRFCMGFRAGADGAVRAAGG
jgi:hypothetical protein